MTMSLNSVHSTITTRITPAIDAMLHVSAFKISVNPSKIVVIDDSGFKINVNLMNAYTPYIIEFRGSKYLIWKNKDSALVVTEIVT